MTHARDILASSDNPNWRTPGWLVKALLDEFDIVLDCSADGANAVVPLYLGPDGLLDDALTPGITWWTAAGYPDDPKRAALFCNPPYSRELKMPIDPWIERLAQAGELGTAIGVVPFSPQTKWWRTFITGHTYHATEIRKFPVRLKFEPPPDYVGKATGSNVNTAIVIWRPTGTYDGSPWGPFERYWVPSTYPRPARSGETRPDEEE